MRGELMAYGKRAWLLRGVEDADRFSIGAALAKEPPLHFEEYVLGHSSILLIFAQPVAKTILEGWLSKADFGKRGKAKNSKLHKVPVVYDGPDLGFVAEATGRSVEEVIKIHSEGKYSVRMIGFTPGFPYLEGLDPRLQIDRRNTPRNRIEPGTVAIGGPHAGIYTVASPGGWNLLGRTNLKFFQADRCKGAKIDTGKIFRLKPGDQVQFVPQQ
ncbi:MAG: allophanate hydrolase subunit 1 [Verrucomicrobiota bacterium]